MEETSHGAGRQPLKSRRELKLKISNNQPRIYDWLKALVKLSVRPRVEWGLSSSIGLSIFVCIWLLDYTYAN